ncbi:MAG: DUF255 domain-containing protein [Bacteroidetes bacterium]|nr:DUF255 domain-containing protein [Bacteroidota bacterium]
MKKIIFVSLAILISGIFMSANFASKPKPKKKAVKAKTTTPATTSDKTLTWYTPTEGFAKAKKESKILIVDVYTDWCYWCKVMDKETYTNVDIISKLNQYYVAIKFNPENNGTHKINGVDYSSEALLQLLNKGGQNSGYPTTFFWKKLSDNTAMSAYPGFRKPDEFNVILNEWVQK